MHKLLNQFTPEIVLASLQYLLICFVVECCKEAMSLVAQQEHEAQL